MQTSAAMPGSPPVAFKKHRAAPFTSVDNRTMRDPNISWQATGLLAYLLGLPDDWRPTIADLTTRKTNGRDSTTRIMAELRDAGYVVYERVQGPDGKWSTTVHVHERPRRGTSTDILETRRSVNPTVGKPGGYKKNQKEETEEETNSPSTPCSEEGEPPVIEREPIEPDSRRRTSKPKRELPSGRIQRRQAPAKSGSMGCAMYFANQAETRQALWCSELTQTGGSPSKTNLPALSKQLTAWRKQHGWDDAETRQVIDRFFTMVEERKIAVKNRATRAPWTVFVGAIDLVVLSHIQIQARQHVVRSEGSRSKNRAGLRL